MIHKKIFQERLHILIGERGVKPFERKTGISEMCLTQYLSGECLPTLRDLERIAAATGVATGWLIGEDQDPHISPLFHQQTLCKSMQDLAHWISIQQDGINYWEIVKAKMAQEFPEFKNWLKENKA